MLISLSEQLCCQWRHRRGSSAPGTIVFVISDDSVVTGLGLTARRKNRVSRALPTFTN